MNSFQKPRRSRGKGLGKKKRHAAVHTAEAPSDGDADNLASRYQMVSHVDHILLRPEMYVGSIENHRHNLWLFAEGAARADVPDLLPPGAYEKRLAELKMHSVKLSATRGPKKDGDGDGAEAEVSVDDMEGGEEAEVEVEEVNGVDRRLLSTEDTVSAFPPGSQAVDRVFTNPGLLKIVDEIVVNAADNRLVPSAKKQTYIRVTFDGETGEISVENDGAAIPIALHPEHKIYVPEMIFGSLLTSSHYGNDPNSIAAGRHGFGAKLTNILSSRFTVECVKDNMRFVGTWVNNMKEKESTKVGPFKHKGDYTRVSFIPEYNRFTEVDLKRRADILRPIAERSARRAARNAAAPPASIDARTAKMLSTIIPQDFNIIAELGKLLKRRLLDLSASIGGELEVYYNGELLTPRDFAEYVRMHMPEGTVSRQPFVQCTKAKDGNCLSSDYGIVFVPPPPKSAEGSAALHHHVSLVNGIVTHQGGTHLRHLASAFDEALAMAARHLEKEERLMLNVALIKHNSTLFVNALVHQSKFDSQSKDRLVSKHSFAPVKVGDLMRHILLLPFIRNYCLTSDKMTAALETALSSIGRHKNLMRVIPKLVEPADMTVKMHRTLILTEGDSAKALALNSLSADQRQQFGVLPLRGKVLNVRNAHPRKIAANKEIVNVLATLGLSTKAKYTSDTDLRYQRLMIMTDQDYDGFHIRGLVVSLINYYWPELMKAIPDFVSIFSTPLIKARVKGEVHSFYCFADYKRWRDSLEPSKAGVVKVKYYKGLGTSSTEEGRAYFKAMEENVRFIKATDADADAELMDKTFSNGEDNIRWRKNWVLGSKIVADMESGRGSLTIPDFVNQQLVQYALADNLRSFPDVRDGLRSSHRKIIWAMLNRKSNDSLRVSQAAGYVSEISNYHHGENSLLSGIIGLAQTHVGSNNVPLLLGEGQFGSRINAGRDAAAPRYIFTNVSGIARKLFPAADDELLTYEDQEGTYAEPIAYAPVLPMQFVNGATGIGVGFAGRHLPHSVPSIVSAVRAMLQGKEASQAAKLMKVGVTGFRGEIVQCPKDAKRVWVYGDFELYAVGSDLTPASLIFASEEMKAEYKQASNFALTQQTLIRIVELPYGWGIEDYRRSIADKLGDVIVTMADNSGANHVDIHITVNTRDFFSKIPVVTRQAILEHLSLVQSSSSFMVCIDDGTIRQYGADIGPQLARFFEHRMGLYAKRLELKRARLAAEVARLEGHIKFTEFVKTRGSQILMLTEEELFAELEGAGVPKVEGSYKAYVSRSIASLLRDNADNLREKLASTKDALEGSQRTDTPSTLWAADLDAFEVSFAAYEAGVKASIARAYKRVSVKAHGVRHAVPIQLNDLVSGLVRIGHTHHARAVIQLLKKRVKGRKRRSIRRLPTRAHNALFRCAPDLGEDRSQVKELRARLRRLSTKRKVIRFRSKLLPPDSPRWVPVNARLAQIAKELHPLKARIRAILRRMRGESQNYHHALYKVKRRAPGVVPVSIVIQPADAVLVAAEAGDAAPDAHDTLDALLSEEKALAAQCASAAEALESATRGVEAGTNTILDVEAAEGILGRAQSAREGLEKRIRHLRERMRRDGRAGVVGGMGGGAPGGLSSKLSGPAVAMIAPAVANLVVAFPPLSTDALALARMRVGAVGAGVTFACARRVMGRLFARSLL